MAAALLNDQFINVDGIRTRYWAAGEKGSTVILVHGLGGFIENWDKNILPLSTQHRVYALDLIGFGQTDKTPLIRDIYELESFLLAFMKAMKIEKASLIGNSLGGGLVLQIALNHPEKVEKLVLVDNAGIGRDVLIDFRMCTLPFLNKFLVRSNKKSTLRLLKKLVYDETKVTPEFFDISYNYASAPGASKSLMNTLCAGISFGGQKAEVVRALKNRLGMLKVPTLIIWGKQDRIIPVTHAQIAVKNIPNAKLEIFDKCGHIPMYECPEKFNKIVQEFLG
jgi:pimeloyl-ACP methyl ester carboxylesterase